MDLLRSLLEASEKFPGPPVKVGEVQAVADVETGGNITNTLVLLAGGQVLVVTDGTVQLFPTYAAYLASDEPAGTIYRPE